MAASNSRHSPNSEVAGSSTDILPRLVGEMNRIEGNAKRLSLPPADKCCDKCAQHLPPFCDKYGQRLPVATKSQFCISSPSLRLIEGTMDPICTGNHEEPAGNDTKPARGLRFWSIIASVIVCGMMSALEMTIVGTALPTIVSELGGAEWYIWAINAFLLTTMVFTPLYGQMANIFGRRYMLMLAIMLFLIGSAISGGARSMETLIAGRAVQGSGAGPMAMLGHLIVSDIVPLRERGTFMSFIYVAVLVGTGIGPFVGGVIVQHKSWRWIFLLNLPIGGFTLLLVTVFLRVNYNKESTIREKLKRVDFLGNAIFIPSVIAILLALTYGGTIHPWSSWRVIIPLVFGFIGLGLFGLFEHSKYCIEPTMPDRLFTNRTTVVALALSFITYMLLYWVVYFLPVYFQSVQGSSPSRSGVQLLPFVFILIPFTAGAGRILSKFGRYRVLHITGFAFTIIGFGLMTLLISNSSTAEWVCYQTLVAMGIGILGSTLLPAVQAPLSDRDAAAATATWGFVRSFGMLWGAAIPASVFSNRINQLAHQISDPTVRSLLSSGRAYEYATSSFIRAFHGEVRTEIISVYSEGLKLVWQVATGIAGLGFILVFVEKGIKLRTELVTDYGITEGEKAKDEGSAQA